MAHAMDKKLGGCPFAPALFRRCQQSRLALCSVFSSLGTAQRSSSQKTNDNFHSREKPFPWTFPARGAFVLFLPKSTLIKLHAADVRGRGQEADFCVLPDTKSRL